MDNLDKKQLAHKRAIQGNITNMYPNVVKNLQKAIEDKEGLIKGEDNLEKGKGVSLHPIFNKTPEKQAKHYVKFLEKHNGMGEGEEVHHKDVAARIKEHPNFHSFLSSESKFFHEDGNKTMKQNLSNHYYPKSAGAKVGSKTLSKAWEDHLKTNLKVGDKVKGKEGGEKIKGKVVSIKHDNDNPGGGWVDIKEKHQPGPVSVERNSLTSHKQKIEGGGSVKFKKKNFEKAGGMEDKMDLVKNKEKGYTSRNPEFSAHVKKSIRVGSYVAGSKSGEIKDKHQYRGLVTKIEGDNIHMADGWSARRKDRTTAPLVRHVSSVHTILPNPSNFNPNPSGKNTKTRS